MSGLTKTMKLMIDLVEGGMPLEERDRLVIADALRRYESMRLERDATLKKFEAFTALVDALDDLSEFIGVKKGQGK